MISGKSVISAVIGGAIGSAVTYLLMKRKCDERIQAEIERFKDEYRLSMDIPEKKNKEEGVHDPLGRSEIPLEHSSIEGGPVFKDTHRTDYSKLAKNYMKTDNFAEELQAGKDAETILAESEAPSENDICIISADEYNVAEGADVTELFWYTEDDILEDEYGEEVEFRENLVGDCIQQLKDAEAYPVDNEGLVYIRNDNLNTIYAVEVIVGVKENSES